MSHAVTVPPGRGVGALEAPQDRHGQEHRTGTSRAEQTTEAMAELGALEAMVVQGAQEAMADHLRGLGLGPLGPAPTARTLTTQDRKALRGQTNRTRQDHPQEQEVPGLAWKLRLLLGMTRSQGPSTGALKTCLWRHGTALLAVMWTGSTGLESVAGRRARVSRGRRRHLPRTAGWRARGTRGDPAELPRRLAVGYGEITSGKNGHRTDKT